MQIKAGLIPYRTKKSALKNKIKHRINVLQERLPAKKITTFKELKSNIGDFKKHFDNEVFLDFTNIAEESDEEKQIMLFCSGWAKTLMSQTEAIYIDGTYKKASKLFQMLYAVMAEVTNRTADKAVPVAYILMRHQTKQNKTKLETKYQDAISTL